METRRIGSLEVPVIGLGCNNFGWKIDAQATQRVVDAALDAGVTFFDTADVYDTGRSEEFLGRALRGRRAEVVIATKYGKPMSDTERGARPEYIHRACESSLRRLGTDYIDLYQQHDPDPSVPIAETLGALEELVRAGKVREVGCSNFSAEQLEEAERAGSAADRARFVSVQNEYNLLRRDAEADVLPLCERLGVAFLPYYPLASGLLTGKYRAGTPAPEGSRLDGKSWFGRTVNEERLDEAETLRGFAESRGHTLLELAFAGLLAQPAVASVIAGATSPEQVRANAAAGAWRLSEEEIGELHAVR